MSTDSIFARLYDKKLLPLDQLDTFLLQYMRGLVDDATALNFGKSTVINNLIPVAPVSTNRINIGATGTSYKATNGLGKIIKFNAGDSRLQNITIPVGAGTLYGVALETAIIEDRTEVNPRTGKVEYRNMKEEIGRIVTPTAVTWAGGVLTFILHDYFEPSRDGSGRTVRIWLKPKSSGGLVGPLVAVDGPGATAAFYEDTTRFDGVNNYITITSATPLGQTAPSTTPGDYVVLVKGPTVRRTAVEDLRVTAGAVFLATVTSVAAAASITTITTVDQRVSTLTLVDLASVIGINATSDTLLRRNNVDFWQILASGALAGVGGNRAIQNVLDPVNDQDAVTKKWVVSQYGADDFESTVFPPTTGWTTPSPAYATDAAWIRSTATPIAGTASASAPVPQAANTNSSIRKTAVLAMPARVSFLFSVNGNANNSDRLEFYIDGTLTCQFSTQISGTLVAGKFISDPLREGSHTFDWRWVRGASAVVAAPECQIDAIEIVSDFFWMSDPNRFYFFDDGWEEDNNTASAAHDTTTQHPPYVLTMGPGVDPAAGRFSSNMIIDIGVEDVFGGYTLAPDGGVSATAYLRTPGAIRYTQFPFIEFSVKRGTSAKMVAGFMSTDGNQYAGIGALVGTSTTFHYLKSDPNNGTADIDSGIAIPSGTGLVGYARLGIIMASVRGVTSAVFRINGKSLPGTGGQPPLVTNFTPQGSGLGQVWWRPGLTATGNVVAFDWLRVMGLRS